MQVHHSTSGSFHFNRVVLTIGTFDGVHKGHRKIIEQMLAEAKRIDGETALITFEPHPRDVIYSGTNPVPLLNTIYEKAALLELMHVDHLVVIPFTETFARMEANAYVENFLINQFHPHTIIIGYDHRFGAERKGDYKLLEKYRDQQYFLLEEIPMQVVNDINVSSTGIRNAISAGNVREAAALLGYPYFFEGTVSKGNQMGRKLGYPTANLSITATNKLLPQNGVYAVFVTIHPGDAVFPVREEFLFKGMMNLGFRPTVGGDRLVTEVHIFDFEGDLYGKTLRIYLEDVMRTEKKFDGLEALRAQLQDDERKARKMLSNRYPSFNEYFTNTNN